MTIDRFEIFERRGMKALRKPVCELCGGTEFLKEDGMFVCQGCGTKYSLEEAKRLMSDVEGDASQASVASNPRMDNLYERARKSLEVNDLKHAAEYYKQILDENPNDWEAYFYSYLGETTSFTNAQAASVASKLGSTIPAAYDYAVKSEDPKEIDERVKIISQRTAVRLTDIAQTAESVLRQYEGGFAFTPTGSVHHNLYQNLRPMAQSTIVSCVLAFDHLIEKVETLYRGGAFSEAAYAEGMLTLRRAQYTVASITFESMKGVRDCMVKQEALAGYLQKLSATEQYYNAVMFRVQQQAAAERRLQWEEAQERIKTYWEEHAAEKEEILRKKSDLEAQKQSAIAAVEEAQAAVAAVAAEGNAPVPADAEYASIQSEIFALNNQLNALSMFKSKERKEIQDQIAAANARLGAVVPQIHAQRAARNQELEQKMIPLRVALTERRSDLQEIEDQIRALDEELTRER